MKRLLSFKQGGYSGFDRANVSKKYDLTRQEFSSNQHNAEKKFSFEATIQNTFLCQ